MAYASSHGSGTADDPDTGRRSGQGTLAKGSRISGAQRTTLASQYAKRYAGGESIRKIADDAGRSYGFVHNVLKESGVTLRGRGGATRGAKKTASPSTAKKAAEPHPGEEDEQGDHRRHRHQGDEPKGPGQDHGREGGEATRQGAGEEGHPGQGDREEDPGQDDQEGGQEALNRARGRSWARTPMASGPTALPEYAGRAYALAVRERRRPCR